MAMTNKHVIIIVVVVVAVIALGVVYRNDERDKEAARKAKAEWISDCMMKPFDLVGGAQRLRACECIYDRAIRPASEQIKSKGLNSTSDDPDIHASIQSVARICILSEKLSGEYRRRLRASRPTMQSRIN